MRAYGNPSKDLDTRKYRRRLGIRVKPEQSDRWFKRAGRKEGRLEIVQQLSTSTFKQLEIEFYTGSYMAPFMDDDDDDMFLRDLLLDEMYDEMDREFRTPLRCVFSDDEDEYKREYDRHISIELRYQEELAWYELDELADLF